MLLSFLVNRILIILYTSLTCDSNRNLVSSENTTPTSASDLDLIYEQAILREFLDTIDSGDSDDGVSGV